MLSPRRRRPDRGAGPSGRRLAARILGVGLLLGALSTPVGWVVSDRLEQDNDFCNACHIQSGQGGEGGERGEEGAGGVIPLHIDIREDFDLPVPATLAGVHGGAAVESRPDAPGFRCIDCHGGTSLVGRARVKALAAKDAFFYAIGRFEEPTGMRWPLWDEDCRKCHGSFDTQPSEYGMARFHELPVHNAEMPVACVDCHVSHDRGGNPDAWFLHAALVRGQCARCHAEFED